MPSSSPALCSDEAQLFARHHATLRARVCGHVHTSASNVDDACSFAWLQLIRCQPRRASVLEWLTTVAIHEALRLDRSDRRLAPLEAVGEPSTPSTTLSHEQAREALEIVAALPPRQRQLVGLHAAGFTYDEIAALTGTSHRAVDRHLRRARAVLRHP
jgi:RNA polymerase sigma factor (sigma-70 family)